MPIPAGFQRKSVELRTPDDISPRTFEGIVPTNAFEQRIVNGDDDLVSPDAVALGHDVLRLFRFASHLVGDESRAGDPTVADRYPPSTLWDLSIEKVAAHLARTAGPDFTTKTMYLTWANTMNAVRVRREYVAPDGRINVVPKLRDTIGFAIRGHQGFPKARIEAWKNFQMAVRVLGPIFAGEVKRADLSA